MTLIVAVAVILLTMLPIGAAGQETVRIGFTGGGGLAGALSGALGALTGGQGNASSCPAGGSYPRICSKASVRLRRMRATFPAYLST